MSTIGAHRQSAYDVRLEWGAAGAAALAADTDLAVVVDVLSFTTTLTVAAGRGISVLPYRWTDDGAAEFAREHGAALAVGRREALRDGRSDPSLSPASMARPEVDVERLVLPSPNGATICALLAESGGSGDCLAQAAHGPETLRTPEPGFFVLGAKSYGRNPHFLLRTGWQQVEDALGLLQPV